MGHTSIIDDLKKTRILELLEQGSRIDGRKPDQTREIRVEPGAIPKANGSARVFLGDTEVVAGVKIQPDRPFPDMGDKGIFICTAEILPVAHPDIETGPPGPDVIELARVVDRGIRESHMVDLSQLVIQKDKSVVGVFVDNSIVDHAGNLFDACSYASTAAILSAKTPKWEIKDDVPTLVEGAESPVPVTTIPVSVTMARIGDHILVDPNADEWDCMDARITITTDSDGNICALQKGGHDGFTHEDLVRCAKMSVATGSKIREIIKSAAGQ